jgi:hypothetical protein
VVVDGLHATTVPVANLQHAASCCRETVRASAGCQKGPSRDVPNDVVFGRMTATKRGQEHSLCEATGGSIATRDNLPVPARRSR